MRLPAAKRNLDPKREIVSIHASGLAPIRERMGAISGSIEQRLPWRKCVRIDQPDQNIEFPKYWESHVVGNPMRWGIARNRFEASFRFERSEMAEFLLAIDYFAAKPEYAPEYWWSHCFPEWPPLPREWDLNQHRPCFAMWEILMGDGIVTVEKCPTDATAETMKDAFLAFLDIFASR